MKLSSIYKENHKYEGKKIFPQCSRINCQDKSSQVIAEICTKKLILWNQCKNDMFTNRQISVAQSIIANNNGINNAFECLLLESLWIQMA